MDGNSEELRTVNEPALAQSATADDGQDHVGERAAEGQSPQMPDRAEEKRVDVPQNEAPVQEDGPAQAEPTQTETVTETHTEQVEKPADNA